MADRPEVVRGHPDELPEDLPFYSKPEGEPTPFNRELVEKGRQGGRSQKPVTQQSLFVPALIIEERKVGSSLDVARRALTEAERKEAEREQEALNPFPEQSATTAQQQAVNAELKARSITERLCRIHTSNRVNIMNIQSENYRDAVLTELEAEFSNEGISTVKVAFQEWTLANDAGDPSTKEAGALWEQYLAYLERFSTYVTSNAEETLSTSDGRLIIKPANMDEVKRRRDDGRNILNQFLTTVQSWYAEWRIARKSDDFSVHTSQEFYAVGEAASNGKIGRNWHNDEQDKKRIYSRKGLRHSVKISLLPEEETDAKELGAAFLQKLTDKQDADCFLAMLYVANILLERGSGWVELNDVAKKIGRNPARKEDYAECRRDVYDYLKFGERAEVHGSRSVPYYDKTTDRTIDTHLESPLWKMLDKRMPDQPSLLNDAEYRDTPVAVYIALSKHWQAILRHPDTKQFLPCGELLGSIPGKRASGAYAKVIGLMLLNIWRRTPHSAMNGVLDKSRRELLTTVQPKVAPPLEILKGENPGHLVDYYFSALDTLVEKGIVAPLGEADPRFFRGDFAKARREGLPEQGWQEEWLKVVPRIYPGPKILPYLQSIAHNKHIEKPKSLRAKPKGKPKPSTD